MTRRKGIAVFLLAVFLLSLAAGCSSSGSNGTAAPEATEAATQAPGTSAPTESTETAAPTEEAGTYPGLPIVEETATITYWYEMHPLIVGRIDGLKDNITWQYLEEITNVHVEFIDVVENSAERFNIMCASGDIADVMISGRDFYPGGSAKGIEDGIFLELTDVIENYMPNYKAAREADEEVYRDTMLSDGSIGDIFQIYRHAENPTTGPIVRLDWLEDLGIDPESIITYDDYHDMLLAFKTEKGADNALLLNAYGVPMSNYLIAGYGVAGYSWPDSNIYPFYQVDGEVRTGWTQPEFKEYLTMMHDWYAEGLFNSDFVSNTNPFTVPAGDVTDGSVGLWWHRRDAMQEHIDLAVQEGFESVAIRDAVKAEGDKTALGSYTSSRVVSVAANISADCEQVETVARWMDFFFTEEGSIITSFGVEGVTFEYNENGEPEFTDLIFHNDEDLGMVGAINVYVTERTIANLMYEDRCDPGYSERELEAGEIWKEALDIDNMHTIPANVELSVEDATAFNDLYEDISTYGLENIPQFIMGIRPLDEFDDFVATIESMGIEECLSYWQNAYDAYMAN